MNNDLMLVPRELLELIEKSWRVPDGCPREVAAEVRDIIGGGLDQLRSLLAAAPAVLAAPVLEDEGYPPCDYCGNTPDYHPWHGSGLLNGAINKHIHACDECRSKLPAHAPVRAVRLPTANELECIIRNADGGMFVGAFQLARQILDAVAQLNAQPATPQQ